MKKLIIYGTGQVAEIVYKYFCLDSEFEVVAFTVNKRFNTNATFFDLEVINFEEVDEIYPPDEYFMFVAASYKDLNSIRELMYISAKKKGYKLASYISTKSNLIDNIKVGENTLILENQVIQPFSKIGNNVFIWGGCIIGHHTTINDHCWLTSGTSLGGNTIINKKTFFGLNSTVGHFIEIGKENFIGAKALITKNTLDKSVYIEKDTIKFKLDSDRFLMITKMT